MKHLYQQKIVLCIGPQQILAGVWRGVKFQKQLSFTKDTIGQQAFIDFVQQHPQAHYYVVLNLTEEDYQRQLLPHCTGRSRKMLLARKLAQAYQGIHYKTTHHGGREQTTPHRDIHVFAALREEQALQPWLQIIISSNCKVAGIYLLSMLTAMMLRTDLFAQKAITENLLVCERLSAGLRQTYFNHGHLNMSRLLTNVPQTENDWLDFCQVETEKIRLYLTSQRFIAADMSLSVLPLNQNPQESHHLIRLAKRLHLPLPALQQTPELAHMQLLINGAKISNLAPQSLTQPYQMQCVKHRLTILSLLLAICVACSAYYFRQGVQLASESQRLSALVKQAHAKQSEQKRHMAQQHPLMAEADNIKNTVDAARHIAAFPASPQRAMQVLSDGFSKMAANSSAIQMKTLDWSFSPANTAAQSAYEIVMLNLTISSTHAADSAEQMLTAYVSQLRQHPDINSVEILPTAASAKPETLQGSTAHNQNLAATTHDFQLKLTLRPENAKDSHDKAR